MKKEESVESKIKGYLVILRPLLLRLFLRLPLILASHLCAAIGQFFIALSEGFDVGQGSLKQITAMPYLAQIEKDIAKLSESQKLKALKSLRSELDV